MARLVPLFRVFPGALFQRPQGPRALVRRGLVLAAVVAAAVTPFLLSQSGGDLRLVAGEEFVAQLDALAQAEAQLAALRQDPAADSAAVAALEARVAEIQEQTALGSLPRDGDAARVGAPAPDFRLLDLSGAPVRLSEVGRPAVVNFWASWCSFCVEEMPDFQRLHAQFGDRVAVIGVNRGESPATVQRFAEETGTRYTILLDPGDEVGTESGPYHVVAMPTTYYVGADGRIAEVVVGFQTLERIRQAVGGLLGESLAAPPTANADYLQRAEDIVRSQQASQMMINRQIERWEADPAVIADETWQRMVMSQERAWVVNLAALQALTPPSEHSGLHEALLQSLQALHAAAGLLEAAAPAQDAEQIGRGFALFAMAQPGFDRAAADLLAVLAAAAPAP